MKEIITKCGYRCDLCIAYRPNIQSPADQQKLSDGWHQYFGFRIPPEKIVCDGCHNNGCLIDSTCQVRACVLEKDLEHCAQCENFICEKLETRIVDVEELIAQYGQIPEEDYEAFIRPYANRIRLMKLKNGE